MESEELAYDMKRLKKLKAHYLNRANVSKEREELATRIEANKALHSLLHAQRLPFEITIYMLPYVVIFLRVLAELLSSSHLNGDLMSIHFEGSPLPDSHSVKAIFDCLQVFAHNIEINLSDVVGDITLRENDDVNPESSVAQHRFVTMFDEVLQTDINSVMFPEYQPPGPPRSGEHEFGLMICDAVGLFRIVQTLEFARI